MSEMYSAGFVSEATAKKMPEALEIVAKNARYALEQEGCTAINVTTTEGEMQDPDTLEVVQGFNVVAVGKKK